jgi:DNA-binding protein
MSKDNIIYIGKKNPMNYVMAVIRTLNLEENDEVVLKARGRAISLAVDVAEITRNRFLTKLEEPRIDISTEELSDYNGTTRNVSAISISLSEFSEKDDTFPKSKDLTEISGVGTVTEKKLKEAGLDTIEELTRVSAEDLAEKAALSIKIAENIIESAKSFNEN